MPLFRSALSLASSPTMPTPISSTSTSAARPSVLALPEPPRSHSICGPAIIGANTKLTDCYVGPYSAIGENCVVERAEIEHSILLAGAEVRDLNGRMEGSLLGREVKITRGKRPPKAYRFKAGDNCEKEMF